MWCMYLCMYIPFHHTHSLAPLQFGLFPFSGQLHRCFRLQVESLKKLGKQAQGCKMVTLWLAALQPYSPEHMAEPVTFWVRETLAFLLREELQAYKSVRADTGQERFNIICDLLELSPEETPAGAWARATHLVELAQVLCYHDFAQQTNW
ncbi:hypothetical protein H8959_014288 [Pygathrix nigripes]